MDKESERLEKAELIKRIRMSESLRTEGFRSYSYKPSNPYKTALIVLFGILGIGSFGLIAWLVGRESKRDKCESRD